jgi:hypothetical protein
MAVGMGLTIVLSVLETALFLIVWSMIRARRLLLGRA